MYFGVTFLDNFYDLWSAILQELAGTVSNAVMSTWIKTLEPVSFEDDCFVLEASTAFKKNQIDRHWKAEIENAASQLMGFDVSVEIVASDSEQGAGAGNTFSSDIKNTQGKEIDVSSSEPTFNNFIVGSTNQFAYVAAVAVTNNPGSVHNPLFIYGESGLGKTHLLKAIRAELKRTRPNMNILFTSGENFLNEMISHLAEKNMSEFHNKYRNADILLMDDIQFIGKTSVAQEEFFHTFEALINQGKQIVLTSDRPPKDIPTLEERLRSRFVQGLLADIQPPMLETRIAIIRRKAQVFEMNIPDDVVEFIAERLKTAPDRLYINDVILPKSAMHRITLSTETIYASFPPLIYNTAIITVFEIPSFTPAATGGNRLST